ncbi:hypothetical protein BJY59DRAFT_699669 [Rhodotorula toruloides]
MIDLAVDPELLLSLSLSLSLFFSSAPLPLPARFWNRAQISIDWLRCRLPTSTAPAVCPRIVLRTVRLALWTEANAKLGFDSSLVGQSMAQQAPLSADHFEPEKRRSLSEERSGEGG